MATIFNLFTISGLTYKPNLDRLSQSGYGALVVATAVALVFVLFLLVVILVKKKMRS